VSLTHIHTPESILNVEGGGRISICGFTLGLGVDTFDLRNNGDEREDSEPGNRDTRLEKAGRDVDLVGRVRVIPSNIQY
jgi:hypothetical protein